jgi:subtilase family serine protease
MKITTAISRNCLGMPASMQFVCAAAMLVFAAGSSPLATQAQDSVFSAASTVSPQVAHRITKAIDEGQLLRLTGNVHPLAQARFDQGAASDAMPMDRMLLLLNRSPEQEATLRQLLEDQLTLNSPKRHVWLTPAQFGAQFGPSDADIETINNWLTSKGFHGIKVGAGRSFIEFSGNVGQVRDAFRTQIHAYSVKGETHYANSSDPQIPVALSPLVAGIVSLHNFPRKSHSHSLGTFRRTKETGVIQPLFSFAGCGSATGSQCNGVGPGDFAKIYNVPSNLDGTGQTIAVVGDSNIDITDAQQYRAMFGLPTNDPTVILNGPDPGIIADEGEADLDVQLSGGVAPKAAIKFVVSEDTLTALGIDLSALYIIDNNIAGVMSESFGGCESGIGTTGNAFYNALWEQAAAQGITVLVSTGDNGSANCDDPNSSDFAVGGLAVSGLASTPFNVAVGGTDFTYSTPSPSSVYWNVTNGASGVSAKSYIPEIPWSDSCAFNGLTGCTPTIVNGNSSNLIDLVAASGGPSSVYTKPAWQTGTNGMPADGKRDTPDISLFASNGQNNSFYITCQKDASMTATCDLNSPFQDFTGVGGTSASVQAFAGVMALINQSQATGGNLAPRQGNANYILYKLYKSNGAKVCTSNPAAAGNGTCIFYDITTGNISVACQGGSPNCSNTNGGANQYGVLVSAGIPAWTATTGYDLATGLGSVNVTNLAAAWSGVGLTGTTTAITASPSGAIAHGSNASFTVHVSATAGTPTGQVSLIATPTGAAQAGIGPFTLSSGTATFSTSLLPGGTTYSVVAHYSGDGTFAQSDSAPVTVTVNKESSKTFVGLVTFDANNNIISANANASVYGSPYILRIDVTNSAGTQNASGTQNTCSTNLATGALPINGLPCPTGNVTVTDNSAPLNDFTSGSNIAVLTTQGFAEDQPINLSGGTHNIIATYAGDNSYTGSVSATDSITISKAATSVALPGPTSGTTTQPVTLTANISTGSNGGAPTGTVTFTSGTTTLGTAPVTGTAFNGTSPASGSATLAFTFTSTGTKSVTASYSGDINYVSAGPSTAISVSVTQGTTGSFAVSGTPVSVTAGATGASTITVTPSNGFTGAVQVNCAGTGLPPGVTCTPNPLTITVTGAAPVTGQLTIAVAAPSTALTASNISKNQPVFATSNASPPDTGNTPGWWTLSAGTGLSAVLLLFWPGLGGRKRMRAALGLGLLCVVSFTLGCGGGSSGGGGGGGGSTPAATHTTISVTSAKLPSTMNNFAFTVTVTASGATPTGQVQLFDGTTALGLATAVTNGTVALTTGLGAVGTHSITAHYLGDSTTAASSSGALSLTVTGTATVPITTTPTGTGNITLTIQ